MLADELGHGFPEQLPAFRQQVYAVVTDHVLHVGGRFGLGRRAVQVNDRHFEFLHHPSCDPVVLLDAAFQEFVIPSPPCPSGAVIEDRRRGREQDHRIADEHDLGEPNCPCLVGFRDPKRCRDRENAQQWNANRCDHHEAPVLEFC